MDAFVEELSAMAKCLDLSQVVLPSKLAPHRTV
jgi:hypothetical protein